MYLKGLRLILDEAIEVRKGLVRQLGMLLEESRSAQRGTIVAALGRTGLHQGASLRALRNRLERLPVSEQARTCQRSVEHWLNEMVRACDVMVDVGRNGDLARLKETQEHLAASREDARRFNAEYDRLLSELRQRAERIGKAQKAARTGKRPSSRLGALLRRPRRGAQTGAPPS
ncbi:MAG TPA: hypothetical protein VFC93_17820 [Chloroflexota bacterium]|nr:hypothetical protein [Chloroflexota bacterium]